MDLTIISISKSIGNNIGRIQIVYLYSQYPLEYFKEAPYACLIYGSEIPLTPIPSVNRLNSQIILTLTPYQQQHFFNQNTTYISIPVQLF